MRILFVSSEVVPFAKAGGLADVAHYLPKKFSEMGHNVTVVTPKYRGSENVTRLKNSGHKIRVPINWKEEEAEVFKSDIADCAPVYLIAQDKYFDREGLYGNAYGDYEDNAERFIFFSRSVLELCILLNLKPDIIHLNDWQTGLTPVYVKSLYKDHESLSRAATVFTIHNLGAQGNFWVYDLSLTGLGWEYFTPETLEFYGHLSLLKGGIVFSDVLSTVSPTHANEIITPEYGFGMHGVLTQRRDDLFGILNGVDYQKWDPRSDHRIKQNFDHYSLEPKQECKIDLLKTFNLEHSSNAPLVAVISRLVDRKGFDLVCQAFERLMNMGIQFIIMGMGEDKYHTYFQEAAVKYPDRVRFKLTYDESLAHQIQSAADIFLMPSRYEACGLEQLYGMRYGTVPIVRATGGLEDTVEDYDESKKSGTGFKFRDYTVEALIETFNRALRVFSVKEDWRQLMCSAMRCEFSWEKSASEYVNLYHEAMNRRNALK